RSMGRVSACVGASGGAISWGMGLVSASSDADDGGACRGMGPVSARESSVLTRGSPCSGLTGEVAGSVVTSEDAGDSAVEGSPVDSWGCVTGGSPGNGRGDATGGSPGNGGPGA